MAKKSAKVYIGFEEEIITEKTQTLVNFAVNKIGGYPDWPPLNNINFSVKCPLCGLHRFLIIQCYAPLENSPYHRTLYVFACVNPNCWTQSESWTCVRSQFQDDSGSASNACSTVAMPATQSSLTWCNGADEWDESYNGDTANGNVTNVDNAAHSNNGIHRLSDEDDESNSFEMETVEQALGNLQVFDAHNANMSPVQGAVGAVAAPVPAAELEGGDEPGLVTVDTPTAPGNDLQALLHQNEELPIELRNHLKMVPFQFIPKYIYVEEEIMKPSAIYGNDRATELLNKYRKENDMEMSGGDKVSGAGGGNVDDETYEEPAPLHGDVLFHTFLTRLQCNPGQILRYSREESPVLGAPLSKNGSTPDSAAIPNSCSRCGSRLICELQLLPAYTSCLQLPPKKSPLTHLHFLSVLIFTCSQSCWDPDDVFVKETIVFQPEVV